MADDDLRSLQRLASGDDPEAQARYLRQRCRVNGHTWNHYKGGEHLCRVCGQKAPGDPREPGAQTLYATFDRSQMARLMAEEARRMSDDSGPSGAGSE